jgi:transcription antitermination factor NusG
LKQNLSDNEKISAKIQDILVPMEKVFEVKDGKKRSRTKNFFPGYILVQADLDNQVKEFILNTPSVMGFLGTKTILTLCSLRKLKVLSEELPRMKMVREWRLYSVQAIW